jgi:activator of 2-hydroxyglutaryl-CoA dehydratase
MNFVGIFMSTPVFCRQLLLTERTTSGTLLTRMEALTTIARRRALLARERQTGLTMGLIQVPQRLRR